MGVEPDHEYVSVDEVQFSLDLATFRDENHAVIRRIAEQWVSGVKGLLGLAGIAGLVAAPLSVDRLAGRSQVVVGMALAGVFALGAASLLLTMSAAYGTAKRYPRPQSASDLLWARESAANADRRRLVAGRFLAVAATVLLGISIGTTWIAPTSDSPHLVEVRTIDGLTICGQLGDSANGQLELVSDPMGGRVPVSSIAALSSVSSCGEQ